MEIVLICVVSIMKYYFVSRQICVFLQNNILETDRNVKGWCEW